MPVYEFKCERCQNVIEKFYRSIPRVTPEHVQEKCECSGGKNGFPTIHRKLMSNNTFHLKGGGVGWGAGRYSSAAESGSEPVEINEP